ncbi:slr1659 superfamily regulator [Candidatus Viridilinea mediisalina]|uniref:STAS domain-containing protein n=1 Tax=Candidatus Viridilinea mediisalina TaxID=2024553 RepID=A0A2A6RIT2_9CHLR|nr:hypothetical protein [Candidatus Viridilinea mediisalina]PDW03034.1 hypothetical protein CJ255_10960 [Candidatus Viridilinea mediisalina]
MTIAHIQGEEYTIEYEPSSHTVAFRGTVRLQSSDEYAPITELLQTAHSEANTTGQLTLDFRQLQFLNSSGISMISKFVISGRKQDRVPLRVMGNQEIYWQQKSLANLQKLWPKVVIEIL